MYEAKDIDYAVSGRLLLDGADLAVRPGRVTALIGPNGAGKSTLLKVLSGELRPRRGRVLVDGRDIAALGPARLAQRRAVLPQDVQVAFPFTVAEVAAIGLPSGERAPSRIAEALARVDLAGFRDRPYAALSGGEQQRVQIARALTQLAGCDGPGYLLLDEPTSSLDLSHQLMVVDLARQVARAGGGVAAVLHDLNLAAMIADEIVALKNGQVAARGAPAEVLTDAIVADLYAVTARIGTAPPSGPFLLPQAMTRLRGGLAKAAEGGGGPPSAVHEPTRQ
ncbi:heme ABC transporter ATP-binding protein [Ancylobacter defluvii]|uniref:Hemin import ATP-binding protein HmuV n=1 Tax=Ancylobacter defluvii TaxID=1282440 RepID=A0A9W6JWD8_9HYPH|nr:heme ABC transporter ATP-binding protein [Ancylobacter defluvii]MBS7586012.1 heme ABC transporter ATP-binding protein [Ancylobacter defluvii]GLK84392.1 hemin import ATP-binding protein HmuV [Ancylobacter defluvii]